MFILEGSIYFGELTATGVCKTMFARITEKAITSLTETCIVFENFSKKTLEATHRLQKFPQSFLISELNFANT